MNRDFRTILNDRIFYFVAGLSVGLNIGIWSAVLWTLL